jgi:hypothetical protein
MSYPPDRNFGCRLTTEGTLKGLRTVVLENQKLRVTVLVDKGTDIWEFLYKPLDVDFMWRSPILLRDPRHFVPTSSSSWGVWYDYYAGGWQDILPSGGPPSSHKGADFGLHGESSTIPWEFRVLEDRPERVSVVFWVRLYRSPFYVEKRLTLVGHSSVLTIEETVENEASESMALMWGHHPTLGEAFLDEHCVIDTDARRVLVHPKLSFERQRFEPGDEFDWPVGRSRSGEMIDVSRVPAPENNTADMLYLFDFDRGWYAVTNQRLGLGFGMTWPKSVFPYLWFWQVCRGSYGYPWYGRTYNMSLEPFSSCPGGGLAEAVRNNTALWLEAGESVTVQMSAVAYTGRGRVARLDSDGAVQWREQGASITD